MADCRSLTNVETHIELSSLFDTLICEGVDIVRMFGYKYRLSAFKKIRTYILHLNVRSVRRRIQNTADMLLCSEYPKSVCSINIDGIDVYLIRVWYKHYDLYMRKCSFIQIDDSRFYAWGNSRQIEIPSPSKKLKVITDDDMAMVRDWTTRITLFISQFQVLLNDYEPSEHVTHGSMYKKQLTNALKKLMMMNTAATI